MPAGASDNQYDVAVVGGGIVGAGIARDAALRGLRTILLEKDDFGGGTTAGSTRLIHGGLRYLETADFSLVRLDLRERETLLRLAPHLVKPLAFLLPFPPESLFKRLRLRAGMILYDALSFDKTLPSHRIVQGGAVFYDAQVYSPERLALENVIAAAEAGATILNHSEVVGALHEEGRVAGVTYRNLLTGREGTALARIVVNASGPWFDAVAARVFGQAAPRIRATKGVHVACEPFVDRAMILESAVDGRVVFAIPWSGFTWLGTTDTDFIGDPAEAAATEQDVEYLIQSVARALPAARTARRYWTCAGVRALVMSGGSASAVSRMHRVSDDLPGLISVLGGKITGYRAIAEEVTDRACAQLGRLHKSTTASELLPGGGPERSGVAHLDAIYGSRAPRVRELMESEPRLAECLAEPYPDVAAQVVYSVRHEWCAGLTDFMLRRSYLGFRPDLGIEAVEAASVWMARELGWAEPRRLEEVERYRSAVERRICRNT